MAGAAESCGALPQPQKDPGLPSTTNSNLVATGRPGNVRMSRGHLDAKSKQWRIQPREQNGPAFRPLRLDVEAGRICRNQVCLRVGRLRSGGSVSYSAAEGSWPRAAAAGRREKHRYRQVLRLKQLSLCTA